MSDDHSSTMITHIAQSLSRSHENLKSLSSSLLTKSVELPYPSSFDDLYLPRSDFVPFININLSSLSITSKRRRIGPTATKTTTSILDEVDQTGRATLGNASANTFYDSPSSESSSASSSDDEEESDASSEDFDDRDTERISATNTSGTSAFQQQKSRDSSVGSFFIGHNEEDEFDEDEDDEATEEDEYDDDEEDDEDEDDWEPSRIMYTGGSALTPCMSRASMDCDDVRAKPPQRVCSFDWDSNVQRSADSDWDSTCGDDLPDEMDSEDFPTLHTWPHSWIWNSQQSELPSIHFHFEESNPPDQFSWTPLQDSKFGNALTVPGYYAYNVRHPPMMLDPTEEEEEELCFSIEEAAIVTSSAELEDSASLALPSVSSLTLMAPPMYTCTWDTPYQYDPKTGHSSTKVFSLAEQATEAIYSAPASSGSGGSCRWNKIRNARRSLSMSRSPSPHRALKEAPKRTATEEPMKSSIQVSPQLIDDENGHSSLATTMSLPPMPVIRPPPPPPTRTMSEPPYEPVERGRSITRRMSAPVVTRNGKF